MCVVADFAGVIIQTFTPGMMQTNMLDKVKPMKTSMMYKLFCVSPENYARISLNTLGWATIVSGCFPHWLISTIRGFQSNKTMDEQILNAFLSQRQKIK